DELDGVGDDAVADDRGETKARGAGDSNLTRRSLPQLGTRVHLCVSVARAAHWAITMQRTGGSSPIIQASGLTKRYGKLVAASDVTFEVDAGQVFGFLGPNGAGKTTTIRMLTGLVRPTSGTAQVAGFDVLSEPLEVKRRVGYLAESPYLYPKLS